MKPGSRPLLVVLGLACLARVCLVAVLPGFTAPPDFDGTSYDLLARNLLTLGVYGFAPDDPTAFRPPGLPLFMAGLYWLFGANLAVVRVANVALGVATVWLVHRMASRAFGPVAALLAALVTALHPVLVLSTGEIYPETLCLFLLASAIVALTPLTTAATVRRGAVAGVLLALAALTRPNLAPAIPLAVLGVLACGRWQQGSRVALALVVAATVVFAPWVGRNARVFERFIPLTTQTGVILWQANHPHSHGGLVWPDGASWTAGPPPERSVRGWEALGEVASAERFRQSALGWIRDHPAAALELVPVRLARLWSLTSSSVEGSPRPPAAPRGLLLVAQTAFFVLAGLAVAGMVLAMRQWRDLWMLYVPLVVVHATAVVFSGSTRYAIPMALSVACFAAWSATRLLPPRPSHA